jgi:FkbM family methyltransferase
MIRIYPQIDLDNKEVFKFWNQGDETFEGDIIVFDGIFNFPILRWSDATIPPDSVFFYKHFQNIEIYINLPEFSGYRYLFIHKNGEKLELDFTFGDKKHDIKSNDIYLYDDVCGVFFETLCGEGRPDIFGRYPGWTIDLGSSVGGYTAGSLRFSSENVLSIEPNFLAYSSLKTTFSHYDNVYPVWGAISNSSSEYVYGNFYRGNSVGNRIDSNSDVRVPNYRIIDLVNFYKIDEIGLLKIDIEGEEYDVVPNIEDSVLSKTHSIHLETHLQYGGDDIEIINFLKSRNFNHKLIDDRSHICSVKEHYFWKDKL